MTETSIYPHDWKLCSKGDTISQDQCEQILAMSREEDRDRYDLALLSLCQSAQRFFDESLGDHILVKQQAHGLRFLTDAEAVVELRKRLRKSVRDIGLTAARSARVDEARLSDEETRQKRALEERSARYVEQMAQANRQQRLESKRAEARQIGSATE